MKDPRRMAAVDLANHFGFVHVDDLLDLWTPEEFQERYLFHLLTGRIPEFKQQQNGKPVNDTSQLSALGFNRAS